MLSIYDDNTQMSDINTIYLSGRLNLDTKADRWDSTVLDIDGGGGGSVYKSITTLYQKNLFSKSIASPNTKKLKLNLFVTMTSVNQLTRSESSLYIESWLIYQVFSLR